MVENSGGEAALAENIGDGAGGIGREEFDENELAAIGIAEVDGIRAEFVSGPTGRIFQREGGGALIAEPGEGGHD